MRTINTDEEHRARRQNTIQRTGTRLLLLQQKMTSGTSHEDDYE